MDHKSTEKNILTFLENRHTAVLATVDRNGLPHASTISYILDADLNLFFASRRNSQKIDNALNQPYVSVTVFDDRFFPTSAQMNGVATIVDDVALRETVIGKLCDLFWELPQRVPVSFKLPGQELVVVRIVMQEIQWLEDTMNKPELMLSHYSVVRAQHH